MIKIKPARFSDVPQLLRLQNIAFAPAGERYGRENVPPLAESLCKAKRDFADHYILVATSEDQIIGSIRSRVSGDTCHVSRLMVHPSSQGKGIGSRLLRHVEDAHPNVRRFELFTSRRNTSNIRFYERNGYSVFKTERRSDQMELTFMEKRKSRRQP